MVGVQSVYVNDVQVVGTYVQDCVVTGDPPVHPVGDEDVTVRICVESGWHTPYAEYVNDVHVGAGVPL